MAGVGIYKYNNKTGWTEGPKLYRYLNGKWHEYKHLYFFNGGDKDNPPTMTNIYTGDKYQWSSGQWNKIAE